jgi:hypothetical protein
MALVRIDVSQELIIFIFKVERMGKLGLLVTANVPSSPILSTLMLEAAFSSETSVLTRAKLHIPETGIFTVFLFRIAYYESFNDL